MDIQSVKFVKSSPDLKTCPAEGLPEYAFAGRSNVGKSTLLNMLAGVKKLAKTSSTPGKTRLINHFLINDNWYLVDLPGYGYARINKKSHAGFSSIINDYLIKRKSLACLFILIDCRHEPLKNDLEFIQWSGENQIPISLIFTKTDKISNNLLSSNINSYKKILLTQWEELPLVFSTSGSNYMGREEILKFIDKTNNTFRKG
jgi:GTP-binding protein